MRFEWTRAPAGDGFVDYDLHVTTGNVDDEFVGYVRYAPSTGDAMVRECLNIGTIPSDAKEFDSVRTAMRVLRDEIRVAILGGATP
jgi:hypothetical protein